MQKQTEQYKQYWESLYREPEKSKLAVMAAPTASYLLRGVPLICLMGLFNLAAYPYTLGRTLVALSLAVVVVWRLR